MANIQQYKIDATLNKLVRYEEGVMSRRDWLKLQLSKGSTVHMEMRSKTVWNRRRFNAMNWQEQQAYEKRMETKVPCYELKLKDGGFYDITKTEYDHFQTLQLAEDINTVKHDLSNRIEAGIATEEEIEEDMEAELEFMNKYFN